MTLSYRPYSDHDIELLQNLIMEWRKQAPDATLCHPGDIPHRLYNGNFGRFNLSDITRIYSQGDTIVALLLTFPAHAWMDVFIHPDYREDVSLFVPVIHDGYQIVRDYHLEQNQTDKAVGVECFKSDNFQASVLREAGFTEKENDMNLTRRKLDTVPDVVLPDGFVIRSVTVDDAEQLANVHNKSFTPKWTAEIYRNEVMLKPGYSPEREFVVVAPDGQFASFTETWRDTVNKVGLFEPVGTHEDFRRMGLARALMSYVMRQMRDEGMLEAEVGYETSNPASKALYTGLGFEIRHQVINWEKQITVQED